MPQNSFRLYQNPDGPVLGTVSAPILEQDGLFFKDLARTGQLLPYEDWRLPAQTRAEDLAARLSIEEIAGLMMYSPHQLSLIHICAVDLHPASVLSGLLS